MKFINLILLLFFVSYTYGQTLFEEALDSANQQSVNVTKRTNDSIKSKTPLVRLISTNLESVILRGDIQALYEMPAGGGWSNLYYLHYNPQGFFSQETGDMGLMVGFRYYLDSLGHSPSLFLQTLGGFNHNSSWDLHLVFDLGYRIPWKNNIFFDVSVGVNRSYKDVNKDPMVYLKLNLAFALKSRLLPFL